ncbi:MAG: Ig-like domain-containing protein, partial [Longimicrobiales bacterium]
MVPVAVMDITVVPARVDALVSDQTPLTTEIRDQDGNVLTGRDVSWASLDPSVAAVDAVGIITAVGPGQALITATADGVVGSAQVSVQERPTVRISPSSIELATVQGNGGALQRVANVENGGGGTLESLSIRVEYDGGGRQWLTANLSQSEAPAALSLSARATGLSVGVHQAQVVVTSPQGSASLPVELVISEPPPEVALSTRSLGFTVIGGYEEPAAATVQVSNGGGGTLNGLGLQVSYGGSGGWLEATLSRNTAPATLTVRPSSTELSPGTHTATVRVTSSVASSKTITVSYV